MLKSASTSAKTRRVDRLPSRNITFTSAQILTFDEMHEIISNILRNDGGDVQQNTSTTGVKDRQNSSTSAVVTNELSSTSSLVDATDAATYIGKSVRITARLSSQNYDQAMVQVTDPKVVNRKYSVRNVPVKRATNPYTATVNAGSVVNNGDDNSASACKKSTNINRINFFLV